MSQIPNRRRPAGRAKKKGIKSKAVLGSTRRLSRFGKEQKRGHSGVATRYTSRTKAIKKLQLSLKDFRRLCILKGIYPRVPPGNKAPEHKGKSRTFYHIKDVSFLAHEPLLEKFRSLKAFMKKVRRADGRGSHGEAKRLWEERPTYTLDHLVKERYPSFGDAVRDLDDALCTIYLFASLPSVRSVKPDVTQDCQRLTREWEALAVHSHSLRKVFVSIKGIYYQCEIYGERVTWLVPHRFSPRMAKDIDFTLMGTFLEFYRTMIKFVMFKLYHMQGLQYPPAFDAALEDDGAHLMSVALENASGSRVALTSAAPGAPPATAASSSTALASSDDLKDAVSAALQADDAGENDEEAALQEDEPAPAVAQEALFQGLRFFASREVPRESLELCVLAMGGELGWAGEGSPYSEDDASITHHIVDRPSFTKKHAREHIQPQWVYDCINAQFLLPVKRYVIGASLPPHLSPFTTDDDGYIPAYREEIDRLRAAKDSAAKDGDNDSDSDGDSDSDSDSGSESSSDSDRSGGKSAIIAVKKKGDDEERSRRMMMMSKKSKRLYSRMQHGIAKKEEAVEHLKKKRRQLEEKKR
eukprot:g1502.t1